MKKIIILGLMFFLASSHVLAACNQSAARDIQVMMYEFAVWTTEGDKVTVHWTSSIKKQPESGKLKMVETYANMDACLSGKAREIYFYSGKKLMGIASPSTGIKLIR